MHSLRKLIRIEFPIIILLVLSLTSITAAQNKYDFKQFANETGDYFSAPSNWNKNDFITLGLISAATFGLMYADQPIKNGMAEINSNKNNWLMEFGRYWGEPIPSVAISGLLLIHGYAFDNSTTKKIGYEVGQSFIYSVTVSSVLKIIIGRARPYTGNDPFTFEPFAFQNNNWSLPSGHTTVAFSLSTVLAANIDSYALKAAAFVPAFLTAFSRVYQNHHWTSDVFLGAIVGYFVGKFVTDLHAENELTAQMTQVPLLSLSLTF